MQGLFFLACCFVLILLVPLVLYLFTYIYRLACTLCGLPKPDVVPAAGVMLVTFVTVAVAEAVMITGVERGCDAAGLPKWEAGVISFFLFLPIDLVLSSVIHAGLTGLKVGKCLEVWFVQRLIQTTLVIAGVAVAGAVYLARN